MASESRQFVDRHTFLFDHLPRVAVICWWACLVWFATAWAIMELGGGVPVAVALGMAVTQVAFVPVAEWLKTW